MLSDAIRIQTEDFSVTEVVEKVKRVSSRIGGVAVFLGVGRDFSKGREIQTIAFEHYPGMAEKQLETIRERAIKEFHIIEAVIIHRIGEIPIGDNIVLIVVGAEHREEAFSACAFCIDELKRTVPIWKKETTEEGVVWVEERP